jgi:hypothetical protein
VAQRGEVAGLDRGVLGERERDRRHHVRARHPVALEQVEELAELEARHRDERRAAEQPEVHDYAHPVDVKERERGDHDVLP